jgi:hypothetical protein
MQRYKPAVSLIILSASRGEEDETTHNSSVSKLALPANAINELTLRKFSIEMLADTKRRQDFRLVAVTTFRTDKRDVIV